MLSGHRFRPSAACCCGKVHVFSSEQFPQPLRGVETPSPVPGAGGKDGMDEVTASAHPRTWEPTCDLRRKTLTGAAGGLREAPQGLCSAGPPRCSSGLHVPGSVACALLWDCPVSAIGQGQAPGMWARNGGSALGGAGMAGAHLPGERPPAGPSGRETVGRWRAAGWGVAEAPFRGPWVGPGPVSSGGR